MVSILSILREISDAFQSIFNVSQLRQEKRPITFSVHSPSWSLMCFNFQAVANENYHSIASVIASFFDGHIKIGPKKVSILKRYFDHVIRYRIHYNNGFAEYSPPAEFLKLSVKSQN
jgi:hypothetical protein